jgi:hypothetical protein
MTIAVSALQPSMGWTRVAIYPPSFWARSASVSHRSAISMKNDLCAARESRASRSPPRYPCVALSMRGTRAAQRGHAPDAGVLTALASERSSISSVIVPADGTRAATAGKRRLRYVCVFWQLSDKPLLACISSHGVRTPKRNGCSKINAGHLLGRKTQR